MGRIEIDAGRGAPAFLGKPKLPSIAGSDSPITGKLSFSAPARIDGSLRGEVRSSALLVVGEQGRVEGVLRATDLVVLGEVSGEIHCAGRLEIGPGGRVIGRVEAPVLIVNEGAILEAACSVGLVPAGRS